MRFVGVAYRAHDPRWSFSPLSGEGAARYGGRFNPTGIAALYLALDPLTAIAEASQGFGNRMLPLTLVAYDADCTDIWDLSDPDTRQTSGIELSDLAAPWELQIGSDRLPPSWRVATHLRALGAAGVLVPSFAPDATVQSRNLVLWQWGGQAPHRVCVYDPTGRLPRNPLSWQ